jgi:hypothetical protein
MSTQADSANTTLAFAGQSRLPTTPISSPVPLATDGYGHTTVDAVKIIRDEDHPRAHIDDNGWLIRQHDAKRGILRESTNLYATADQAYDAYWGTQIEWESWVSPLHATPAADVAEAA